MVISSWENQQRLGRSTDDPHLYADLPDSCPYLQEDRRLILLLCGGDKSSQQTDIEDAKRIAADWRSRRAERPLTCGNAVTIGCQGSARAEYVRKFLAPTTGPSPTNRL